MPTAPFTSRYTPAEREAARRELAIGVPPPEVCRRAAAGELAPGLAAFTLAPGTARTWRDQVRRDAKRAAADAAAAERPGDVIAELRGELLAAIRAELRDVKRRQVRRSDCRHCKARLERVSGEELRQLGRALRETQALLPGGKAPGDHAPPGSTAPSRQPVPGIAGDILAEHRKRPEANSAQKESPHGSEAPAAERTVPVTADQLDDAPGSHALASLAVRGGGDAPLRGAGVA